MEIVNRLLKRYSPALHATVSAEQFAHLTNNPDKYGFQGATMDPKTFEVAQVEKTPWHAVGGARNAEGGRIMTQYVDPGTTNPQITPEEVLQHAFRVRAESGFNPQIGLGSWVDTKSKKTRQQGIQMDASDLLPADTPKPVIRKMLQDRNEKESFNVQNPAESVRNYKWRKSNGQK